MNINRRCSIDEFPNVQRWLNDIVPRPAVTKAYETGLDWFRNGGKPDEESRKNLFDQDSKAIDEKIKRAAGE